MIYNIVLYLLFGFGKIISIWKLKARLWMNGRKNWKAKLSERCTPDKNWIWFHCASLGEFEDGRAVIEETKKQFPEYSILLSFSSPSGYEVKKNYPVADYICYLPLDTSGNAFTFVEIVKPVMAVFVRNDIWINYLQALKKKGIPIFLLSFNMNEKSSFLKWPQASFYRKAFLLFDKIFVQNSRTAELLKTNAAVTRTELIGNTRINSIYDAYQKNLLFPEIEKFVGNDFCVIAGSTIDKDLELFIDTYLKMNKLKIKWIIAPHEINISEIDSYVSSSSEMIKYSEIDKLNDKHNFLWIDNVGMLAKIYRYSDIAFVGGGFNKIGIHSIIEPAIYGCPVAFGPNHRSYLEALDLLERKGAAVVENESDLESFITKYFTERELLNKVKKENKEYVLERNGKIEPVMNYMKTLLKEKS